MASGTATGPATREGGPGWPHLDAPREQRVVASVRVFPPWQESPVNTPRDNRCQPITLRFLHRSHLLGTVKGPLPGPSDLRLGDTWPAPGFWNP
jgi:hypothetical protein